MTYHPTLTRVICLAFIWPLGSCSPWKETLVAQGDQYDAVANSVRDFLRHGRYSQHDRVFSVSIKSLPDGLLGVSIYPDSNKVLVSTEDRISFSYRGFPTRYMEQDGKLFYWDDSTSQVSPDLVAALMRHRLVDTMVLNVYIPERYIDHAKKSVDYYLCPTNLRRYKKVRTTRAIGYYPSPTLECK